MIILIENVQYKYLILLLLLLNIIINYHYYCNNNNIIIIIIIIIIITVSYMCALKMLHSLISWHGGHITKEQCLTNYCFHCFPCFLVLFFSIVLTVNQLCLLHQVLEPNFVVI